MDAVLKKCVGVIGVMAVTARLNFLALRSSLQIPSNSVPTHRTPAWSEEIECTVSPLRLCGSRAVLHVMGERARVRFVSLESPGMSVPIQTVPSRSGSMVQTLLSP